MTCAQFLEELNDYLDGISRADIEQHLSRCPGCRVIVDTTRKTVRVYKGLAPCPLPPEVEARLMAAIGKMAAAHHPPGQTARSGPI